MIYDSDCDRGNDYPSTATVIDPMMCMYNTVAKGGKQLGIRNRVSSSSLSYRSFIDCGLAKCNDYECIYFIMKKLEYKGSHEPSRSTVHMLVK